MLIFGWKAKRKAKMIEERQLDGIVQGKLGAYIKRDDLREYLEEIEKDKRKKELWDSLPAYKKKKVLRYALGRKGKEHGKKDSL